MSAAEIGRRSLLGGAGLLLATPGLSRAAAKKPRVAIATKLGVITVELEDRRAPLTTANFLRYVKAAKYDGATFYRAARVKGYPEMGTIVASPGATAQPFPPIAHESTAKTGLKHTTGTISLGRFAPGSAKGDFFICLGDLPFLDAHPGAPGDNQGFAAFGQIVSGLSVARKVLASHTSQDAPFKEQRGEWLKPPIPILNARRTV